MQPVPRTVSVVKDYAGLRTNTGPIGRAPAAGEATELVNLMPLKRGELACRPGYRVVRFDEESLPPNV